MLKQSGNSKKNGDEGTKVFGVAIQTSAEQGGKGIPTVLQDCMQYLRMLGDMTLQLFFTHPDSMKDGKLSHRITTNGSLGWLIRVAH